MKKKLIKLFLFGFASLFVATNEVMAENQTINVDISYGTVLNFIPGTKYDGVKCNIPSDTGYFVFTDTDYSDDHYVEVKSPNAVSGSITIDCSYSKKKSHSGSNVPVTSTNGVDTFVFTIVPPKDLTKFNLELHRQFKYFVDMKTYFTVDANSGADSITLTGDLLKVFENSNGSVSCNTQSCTLYLKQDAKVGISVGKIKYGNHEFELTVDVKDEWVVYANTGGYGTCSFDSGWEVNANNANYFEKAISGKTTTLPKCEANSTFNNRYMALEFVGWVYNKKTENANYNNYQSIDVCATFKDNSNPNVGFISGGSSFAPSEMTYDYRGNSVFYACYKRTGIGFNLLGAKINDDTYQITKWNLTQREGDVTPGIYYKVFDDNTSTMILPSKVESSGLVDNEVFVGWAHNKMGYNGSNPEVLLPGGAEVSVKEGLIYTPQFVIEKTETERNVTVYKEQKFVLELPSSFTCPSDDSNEYYSIVGSGNKCVITGKKSTNGTYLTRHVNGNSKVFTIKIQVVEGSYNPGDEIPGIVIGDGELIIDPGNDDGNGGQSSIKVPANCDSYLVGKKTTGAVKSSDYFRFENAYGNYTGHIFTYYARSNCMGNGNHSLETEFAALCLDPGRAGPPKTKNALAKDGSGVGVTEYKFYRYINVNDEIESYREFSRAVAFIVNDIGNMPLAEFNQADNLKKIAANMALRIIATQYSDLSVRPSEDASGNDGAGVVRYFSAYQAYQSMGNHLRGVIGSNEYKVKAGPSASGRNVDCSTQNRAQYMYCNSEWTWFDGTEALQNKIADYLSYAYQMENPGDKWQIAPTMRISSPFDGEKITVELKYPKTINFRYGDDGSYDVTLNLSEEMAKVYQLDVNAYQYNGNNIFKCIQNSTTSGKCIRYGVNMTPNAADYGDPVEVHYLAMKFVVDDTANIVFPDENARDIYFQIGYSSSYTDESAFMVEPVAGASSIQRMILFNPEKVQKIFPLTLYDCNILLQNYGSDSSRFEAIYNAGCCETISDDSTQYQDFVNTYCKRDCVMNNYKPVCESSDSTTDYKIKEAMTQGGNINYRCVVDATKLTSSLSVANQLNMINGSAVSSPSPYQNTSSMKDITGQNSIAIADYNNNPYCRITCKEDWSFNMPGYNDFLGANAVAAGSVFQINHSIKLSSTVTCVTSYIDIDGYKAALTDQTSKLYNAYLAYSLRAAAHKDIEVSSIEDKGAWYTYTISESKNCTVNEFRVGGYVDHHGNATTISSCGVEGNYTYYCSSESDYNNYSQCRKGQYNSPLDCTKDDVAAGVAGCSASGQYTTDQYTQDPNCVRYMGAAKCAKTYLKANCTKSTIYDSECSASGQKDYYVTCGVGDYNKEGCDVDTTKTYTIGCSESDLQSNGTFRSKGSSNNCKINGYYKVVTQTTNSGSGSGVGNSCLVYTISSPKNTSVVTYSATGVANSSRSNHNQIVEVSTNYSIGATNYCMGNGTCKVSNSTSKPTDYVCETNTSDRETASHWKEVLTNRAHYTDDAANEYIRDEIEDYQLAYKEHMDNIIKLSNAFAKCQNFNINNTTAGTSGYNVFTQSNGTSAVYSATNGVVLNGTVNKVTSSYNIATKLEPGGTFGYDEDYYMSLMGNNRVIDRTSGISLSYKTEMYPSTSVSSNFASCYGTDGNYTDASGTYPCSSTITSSAGVINSESKNVVDNLLNIPLVLCNLSSGYNYDAGDKCGTATFYYYNANYIKKSLTSSADYDNKITWYRYLVNDTLYPGIGFADVNTKKSVFDTYGSGIYDPNDWSVVGTKNVFPVSLTTRRNIYQYYYAFKGIGNYYNNSQGNRNNIGRIMGYDDSIIKSNSRICFYEVYESACICCGANDIGSVSQTNKVNSYVYVSDYTPSSLEKGSGHHGFTTSSVSLYNINDFSNTNAANWKENDHYFYDGNGKYTTNKGSELAGYIEGKGENAYAETPEYSYILTPNAMANIRKLNSSAIYGYGKDTIYQENGYAYLVRAGTESGHSIPANTDVADKIIFTHFGSKFLRDKIAAYETPEYKDNLLSGKGMSSSCYVTAGNVGNLNSMKSSDCKWIDYVQSDGNGGYFRMAFK